MPKFDAGEAARFLALMAPGEPIAFRTFDDRADDKSLTTVLHGTLDQHKGHLQALNDRGAGIFWAVNRTTGSTAADVTGVRAFFLDLDGAPLQPVLDAGVEPHAVIESSPGRWHVYWRVIDCALADFRRIQTALAIKFNGDRMMGDLSRVLRQPGSVHQKGDPFVSRIVSLTTRPPYRVTELVQMFGLELPPEHQTRASAAHPEPERADSALMAIPPVPTLMSQEVV